MSTENAAVSTSSSSSSAQRRKGLRLFGRSSGAVAHTAGRGSEAGRQRSRDVWEAERHCASELRADSPPRYELMITLERDLEIESAARCWPAVKCFSAANRSLMW